jgi:hypothetical protein
MRGFYNTCVLAGPTKCALAARFPTADAIENALYQYLEGVYTSWNAGTWGRSYNHYILQAVFAFLYEPSDWDIAAQVLTLGLNGSFTESSAMLKARSEESRFKLPYLPGPFSSGSVWEAGLKRDMEKRQQSDIVHTGYMWNPNYTLVMIQYVI